MPSVFRQTIFGWWIADFKYVTWSAQSGIAASTGAAGRCFWLLLFSLLLLLSLTLQTIFSLTHLFPSFFACMSSTDNWSGGFSLCCFHCSRLFCISLCHFLSARVGLSYGFGSWISLATTTMERLTVCTRNWNRGTFSTGEHLLAIYCSYNIPT